MRLTDAIRFVSTCFLCLLSSPLGAADAVVDEEAPIILGELQVCKFGVSFLVPWLDDLNLYDQDYGFHSMAPRSLARDENPLDTSGVILANKIEFFTGSYADELLGLLLGQESQFGARNVTFARLYDPGEWEEVLDMPPYRGPRRIGTTAITSDFVVPGVTLFDQPIVAHCNHRSPFTLPVEHDRSTCFLRGRSPDGGLVSMQIRTDPDKEGRWAINEGPWEDKDWSLWQAPLNEIEEIWIKMKTGGDSFSCN